MSTKILVEHQKHMVILKSTSIYLGGSLHVNFGLPHATLNIFSLRKARFSIFYTCAAQYNVAHCISTAQQTLHRAALVESY